VTQPLVSVIVPTFNSARSIERCLCALLASRDVALNILVVDNGSTDDTVSMVRAGFPSVSVVESPDNNGYGASVNLGAGPRPEGHVLALNSDAYLHPDALSRLVTDLADDPSVGAVAPALVNPDLTPQPSAHSFPTLRRLAAEALFIDRSALGRCGRLDYHRREYDYTEPTRVDWATGAALLIRREAWIETGGFDPAYRFYVEEVDLQRRLADRGFAVVLNPLAVCVHEGGKRPVPAEQFVLSHDGFERYFGSRRGTPAGRAARLLLCLTATTRAAAWAIRTRLGTSDERELARRWLRMFLAVTRLSLPQVFAQRATVPITSSSAARRRSKEN
jgi:N-acetylglucosaminyl-diphospho-decaprenol L-rhamnosyltransferase